MAADRSRIASFRRPGRWHAIGFAGAVLFALARPVAADEGWVIENFGSRIEIQPDGVLAVEETVAVDFQGLPRHGIFRDIPYRFDYNDTRIREYPIDLTSVTAPDGRRYPVTVSTNNAMRRFRIGDPNQTVSGQQTYRITYRIRQALNGFVDHDELYWNVSGTWPVAIKRLSVNVTAPGPITGVDCFQGPIESKERCDSKTSGDEAVFSATRVLPAGEQMTIVAAIGKGLVAAPEPRLVPKSASISSLTGIGHSHWTLAAMITGLFLATGGVLTLWWRVGRDRRYVALHRAVGDAQEERAPLLGARPIAVEFQPPSRIRPAQLGLIIDERADTLDVTATIVDLAVRGYLKITELPKQGWFGHIDWQLDRLKPTDAALLDYERIVLDGLFEAGPTRELSDLKNKFYKHLGKAKTALYRDAVGRGWFPKSPAAVRTAWQLAGFATIAAGVFLAVYLENVLGQGPLGVPVAIGGFLLLLVGRVMPRRTAAGSDLLFRGLGFAKYIKTAEVESQAFAERANIFTEYLPYAIVFKCVDRWARAFKDIDLQAATTGWYVGQSGFNIGNFSSSLGSFSASMSQSLASTPGGSGGSGFGGGSGGGGGGGGGGSW